MCMTTRPLAEETTQHHRVVSMASLEEPAEPCSHLPRLEPCPNQLPATWPSYYLG